MRPVRPTGLAFALLLAAVATSANEPPTIDHQPAVCAVSGSAIGLCASVSDDTSVGVARIHFRTVGQKFFSYVNMSFTGLSYCGTLPAPSSKNKALEYYIQAFDEAGEPARSSTYRLTVAGEGQCEFPATEKDAARTAAIEVFATNPKQGKKLEDGFLANGVKYVPVTQ